MANTFTQIHIQSVFAVKYRAALIHKLWKEDLHKYITGIIQNNNHKLLSINSMPDHIHVFFGFSPTQSLADLMRMIKSDSSEWINKNNLSNSPFYWQEGYGAFSYSRSHIKAVCTYIENQEVHHRKQTFLEKYEEMLQKFEIEYDEKYIFKLPE